MKHLLHQVASFSFTFHRSLHLYARGADLVPRYQEASVRQLKSVSRVALHIEPSSFLITDVLSPQPLQYLRSEAIYQVP